MRKRPRQVDHSSPASYRFKDHPWYEDWVYFCQHYDQCAFDPDYDTKPLEFFEPIMRRLFEGKSKHLELNLDPA